MLACAQPNDQSRFARALWFTSRLNDFPGSHEAAAAAPHVDVVLTPAIDVYLPCVIIELRRSFGSARKTGAVHGAVHFRTGKKKS